MGDRRPRRKPRFNEELRPFVDAAIDRHRQRLPNPGVTLAKDAEGRWVPESPHRDVAAWWVQIAEAFGTRSESTVHAFIDQLQRLTPNYHNGTEWRPDEWALNAALNVIAGTQPENEVQAMLAAQMWATHLTLMRLSEWMADRGYPREEEVRMLTRLTRAMSGQAETLARLQGKTGKQHIVVSYERHEHRHQHVHVHEGGEAEFGGQPLGPEAATAVCRAIARRAALPSPDPAGNGLPEADD